MAPLSNQRALRIERYVALTSYMATFSRCNASNTAVLDMSHMYATVQIRPSQALRETRTPTLPASNHPCSLAWFALAYVSKLPLSCGLQLLQRHFALS